MKSNQKFCFVAKANCYGFGSKLCKYFNNFVDYFAVSSASEFFNLRQFVDKKILILDPIYDEKVLKKLITKDCELTISNIKSLQLINKVSKICNKKAKIHIAINSGMNRFGLKSEDEILKFITLCKKMQKIEIVGIFSHYFQVNNKKISKNQLNIFESFVAKIKKELNINPIIHISATSGLLCRNYGDMVRIGFGIYDNANNNTITLKTKIIDFQYLVSQETAGYNGIFLSKKKTKIAVIAIGYGDGIPRNIVKNGYVLINDCYSKIVASCMDSMLVDVTNINCKLNDDVIIIGKFRKNQISIQDVALWCDTIGYEIIVRISDRVKRYYVEDFKCKSFQENTEQEN